MADETTDTNETMASPGGVFENAMPLEDAAAMYLDKMNAQDVETMTSDDPQPAPEEGATDEAPTEESDDTSEKDSKEEAPTEETDDTEAAESTGDEEPRALETLSDLAEQLDIPSEDLLSTLKHTFKAAGEEHTATLEELVGGYQRNADYTAGKTRLAQNRTRMEEESRTHTETFNKEIESLGLRFSLVDKMLDDDMNSQDLATLRVDRPDEWTARVTEIGQKRAGLQAAWHQALQGRDTFLAQKQQKFFDDQGRILEGEVPDWGESKLKTALGVIKTMGFSDKDMMGGEEPPSLMDHRFIKGALELNDLRAKVKTLEGRLTSSSKAATKVKKTIPKMITPSKSKPKLSAKSAALAKAQAAFKRGKSLRDASEVYALTGKFD